MGVVTNLSHSKVNVVVLQQKKAFEFLTQKVDTIIVIPNDKLLQVVDKNVLLLMHSVKPMMFFAKVLKVFLT